MIPSNLVMGPSPWYGTTLYTRKKINKDHIICVTDIKNLDVIEKHINTKYGNVFNNSDDNKYVNCELVLQDNDLIKIVSIRFIEYGEELLVNYDNPKMG